MNGQVLSNLTHYDAYKLLSDASEQQRVCELVVYRESPDSPDRTDGDQSPSSDVAPTEHTMGSPHPTPAPASASVSAQQQLQPPSVPSQHSQSSPSSSSQSRETRTGEPTASDSRTLQQQASCSSPPPGYDMALTRDVLRVVIHKRPAIQLGIKLGTRRYACANRSLLNPQSVHYSILMS